MTGSLYLAHDEATLRAVAQGAIRDAVRAGADEAIATARAGGGVKIVARAGAAETAVRDGGQSLDIVAYKGGRRGAASTTTFDPDRVRRAAEEAVAIAAHVQPQDHGAPADRAWMAFDGPSPDLFAPDLQGPAGLLQAALTIDDAAAQVIAQRGLRARVVEAGAVTADAALAIASTNGFCRSRIDSDHARWCLVLAEGFGEAVQDYFEVRDRRLSELPSIATIAGEGVDRATAALGARGMPSGYSAVLFDARMASRIVGDLVGALDGHSQHHGTGFLPDALGRSVTAPHLDLIEDPCEPFGLASGGFDREGVAGTYRSIIDGGEVRGLFLDSGAARKLGTRPTGNAGGPYNLRFVSRHPASDPAALRRRLHDGLMVTELLGGSTDPVTGRWTQAAAGFRIEAGEIAYPVRNVTLAGTMPTMLSGIDAVGDDVVRRGAIRSGSLLIDGMQIGGTA